MLKRSLAESSQESQRLLGDNDFTAHLDGELSCCLSFFLRHLSDSTGSCLLQEKIKV